MNKACTVFLACAIPAASGVEVRADVPVRILTKDGVWNEGRLKSADAEAWSLSDAGGGSPRRIPTAEIAAFIAQRPGMQTEAPTPLSSGLLEFNTGERLPGNLRAAGSGENYWDHRWIGAVPIDADDLASIRFRGVRVPDRLPDGDTLLLLNGDMLTGFVDSIGESIVFESAGEASEKRTIALDRTAAIAFARSGPVTTALSRFWTVDGSVVDGTDLRFDEADGWGFALANAELSAVRRKRTDDNAAADPVAAVFATARLTPLASLGRPAVSVPEGQYHFGFEDAVRIDPTDRAMLGLASVELDGPIEARFVGNPGDGTGVPVGVFSCEVSLREPFPSDARVDVEIRFGSGRSRLVRLDGSNPREQVRIDSGSTQPDFIVVRLEDGGNGVAGDAIVLRRACILTAPR